MHREAESALSKCLSIVESYYNVHKMALHPRGSCCNMKLYIWLAICSRKLFLYQRLVQLHQQWAWVQLVKADITDTTAKEAAEAAKLAAQKSEEEAKRAAKEKEERDAKKRMELAMQLMQFFPQFSFELAQGALELERRQHRICRKLVDCQ